MKYSGAPFAMICWFMMTFSPQQALASPWVEADDPFLRASLQQLADAGFLQTNVSAYPLMWYRIADEMRDIRLSMLTDDQVFAYYRVRAALEFAQQSSIQRLQLRLASDERMPQGFGVRHREQGALTASRAFTSDFVAGRLQSTVKTESIDGKSYSFEGSYLATTFGNWAFSVDQLDVWWGPGQESALVLSTHATPIQALRLNRLDTQMNTEFASWLPELGNFHLTAFLGRSQRSGALGDHPVFGARASWRPFAQLEMGASYIGQWGGDDYSDDINRAFNVASLENDDEIGNQRGGLDARLALSDKLGVYSEVATNNSELDDLAITLGGDFRFSSSRRLQEVFLEYTEVPANFYDDQRDPAGYRRYGMSMGAGHDQHIESWVFGYRRQHTNGTGVTLRLREIVYGHTNRRLASEYGLINGESVTRRSFDITYQQPVGDSLVRVQFGYADDIVSLLSREWIKNDESGLTASFSWEIRF
ncbi:MAG: hypothetical protein JJU03_05865 [Idiomarina sp.]|nr:hypothetical protein [Idiomarina sp.]